MRQGWQEERVGVGRKSLDGDVNGGNGAGGVDGWGGAEGSGSLLDADVYEGEREDGGEGGRRQ